MEWRSDLHLMVAFGKRRNFMLPKSNVLSR